ncbi:phospholipid-transporting ATPase IB [Hyalella azteca]|uniref:P-type phospholipid transporter n=1 Tax=Hyalella azteca TaxID=294128 RepID=A0A8B7P8P9_HYAAZ|nr:phospholipid-transporting ATPase IB [Hyalella azteca]
MITLGGASPARLVSPALERQQRGESQGRDSKSRSGRGASRHRSRHHRTLSKDRPRSARDYYRSSWNEADYYPPEDDDSLSCSSGGSNNGRRLLHDDESGGGGSDAEGGGGVGGVGGGSGGGGMAGSQQQHRTIIFNDPQLQKYCSNAISTAKYRYRLLFFLPMFLFEQFRRYANIFFLVIALLQRVKVGDIIKVHNNNFFPADLILLASSEPQAICYIETANLDGETNLKIRQGVSQTAHRLEARDLISLRGRLECELPNRFLYQFTGNLSEDAKPAVPLSPDQVLLRGAKLQNTNWIFGVVIYTGHETKLMKNSAASAPLKRSTVDRLTNHLIILLFVLLIILCLIMAVCNSQWDASVHWYLAATSWNERALVKGAKDLGFVFTTRTPDYVILDALGKKEQFHVLHVLEFTSARKRMSVVVRLPNNTIKLYCKGADNVIYDRLAPSSQYKDATIRHLEEFASEGLRTLCFAVADISPSFYEGWKKTFYEASTALEDREKKLEDAAQLIEKNLQLLGASAIEDKLQDQVPETIAALLLALLVNLSISSRVSPSQKAEIVELVNSSCKAVTLAIGDGANDVAMIQKANVGVGIAGQEGLQAACAADYTIGQFRFLARLMLVHGAWNYSRLCKVILYSFYKNICLYVIELWWAFMSGWSGQVMFERWTIAMYNVLFTAAPPVAIGIFDRSCSAKTRMEYPALYKESQNGSQYNMKVFLWWVFLALAHSAIVFALPVFAMTQDVAWGNGKTGGYLMAGNMVYSYVVVTVCLKAGLESSAWTWPTHLAIWGSIVSWFLFLFIYSNFWPVLPLASNMTGIYIQVFISPLFWFGLLLIPLTALLIDFSAKTFINSVRKSLTEEVRESEISNKDLGRMLDTRNRLTETARLLKNVFRRTNTRVSLDIELPRKKKETPHKFSNDDGMRPDGCQRSIAWEAKPRHLR